MERLNKPPPKYFYTPNFLIKCNTNSSCTLKPHIALVKYLITDFKPSNLFFMGNYITYRPSNAKVILWDGTVHEFDKPLTVAELMLEHPQQVVVELHSAVNERRPTPLPADKNLEMKKTYIMLPMKRGKPVSLSSEEARRLLLSANSVLHSKSLLSSSKFLPLFALMCPARVGNEQEYVSQKKENVERFVPEFLPEILDGRPEYLSRELSGKGWKPNLDTIKEKKVKKKLSRWLF